MVAAMHGDFGSSFSFHRLGMHGDFGSSFSFHRLGLLTLLYVFLQFACRLGIFVIPKWRARFIRYGKFLNQGIVVLAVLFGVNWIATLITL
jgi:hypothetical protein